MKRVKLIIDIAMNLMWIYLVGIQFTGAKWHDYVGFALGICFILHQILNWKWYRRLPEGHYNGFRILLTVSDAACIADMIGLLITGAAMPHRIFPEGLIPMSIYRAEQFHMFFGYLGFILVAFHTGLHHSGGFIYQRDEQYPEKKKISPARLAVVLAVSAFGVFAFINEHFARFILLRGHLLNFDGSDSWVFFIIEMLCLWLAVMELAAVVKNLMRKFGKNRRKNSKAETA